MNLHRPSLAIGALGASILVGTLSTLGQAVTPSAAQVTVPIAAGPTVAVISGDAAQPAAAASPAAAPTVAGPPPAAPPATGGLWAPAPAVSLIAPAPPAPAAAPGSVTPDMLTDLHNDVDSAAGAAQRAMILAVIYQADTSGLHELDEGLSGGKAPAGALGKVRRLRVALAATPWPQPLQGLAGKLTTELARLEPALRDENVDAAKGPAANAHDLGHDLSDAAYAWLSGGPAARSSHAD